MKTIILFLLSSFLLGHHVQDQPKTSVVSDNSYIQQYETKEFLKSSLPQQEFDPESFDEELLIATLYFVLHQKRPKFNTPALQPKPVLDKASEGLLNGLSKNRIKQAMRKKRVPKKKWEHIVREAGFKGSFLGMTASTVPLYDYPKRFKVRYKESEDGPDFSYQERKILKPVHLFSYLSLAEQVLKKAAHSKKKKLLNAKGLSTWGCAIRIDQKEEKRLPYLTVVMVGGGYRLGLLEE